VKSWVLVAFAVMAKLFAKFSFSITCPYLILAMRPV
jgi:hypothetical protein